MAVDDQQTDSRHWVTRAVLAVGLLAGLTAAAAADREADRAAGLPRLTLNNFAGTTPAGYSYSGFAYDGVDALFGSAGRLSLRFAQSRRLVQSPSGATNPLRPDKVQDAWQIRYESDAKQAQGLRFRLNWSEVDKRFAGGQDSGFSTDLRGVRQRDFRAGWSQGQLNFEMGRDRAEDTLHSASLSRDVLAGGAYGFTFQREELRVDGTGRLGDGLSQRLLGKDGYGLGQRKLGSAQAGFSDLSQLRGVRDRYQAVGYAQGSAQLTAYDRRVSLRGQTLVDRQQKLVYGGLQVRRATRSMDYAFAGYREIGYTDWTSLAGGREDVTETTFASKLLQAGWTQTRLRLLPGGKADAATLTQSNDYRLSLRPADAVTLGYRHKGSVTGTEKLWRAGDASKLTHNGEDQVSLGWTVDTHNMTLTRRGYGIHNATSHIRGTEDTVAYQYGKRTKLGYKGREERTVPVSGTAESTRTRKLQVTAATALGPSFQMDQNRTATGSAQRHTRIRFDREFIPEFSVGTGYETWRNLADGSFRITGRNSVLAASSRAVAYDWKLSAKPLRTTGFAIWQRNLYWDQAKDTTDFKTGAHMLTEHGVQLTQSVVGDFKLRARWSRFQRDRARDADRREVVAAWEPPDGKGIGTLEVGYREIRVADGHTVPSLVAGARLRPYKGLELQARMARSETVGAAAVAEEWTQRDNRAVQFAATHQWGKDGKASVTFTEAPDTRTVAPGERRPKSRDLLVAFSTPSNLGVKGLRLGGQYHSLTRPGGTADLDEDLREHQASLAWAPRSNEELLASFKLRSLHHGCQREGDSRFELQYTRKVGVGQFQVTGHWGEEFDPVAAAAAARGEDYERYRFGFQYTTPF